MALTAAEITALAPILRREGIDAFTDQARDLAIKDKRALADAALGSAVSVTVSNWTVPAAYVAQATGATLPAVLADIGAALTAKDQSKLGGLFVQLYAASKAHLGL